jgi:hypothetical protein
MEDGEMWSKIKEDQRKKRWQNDKNSIALLKEKGIAFQVLNGELSHYRVGDYDFWATTGKFYNQKTGERGRGVFNLIKKLR